MLGWLIDIALAVVIGSHRFDLAILSVIGAVLGSAAPPAAHIGPISPNSPSNPSLIR
jgi:hypothetical protein